MAGLLTNLIMILILTAISTVLGCGVMPVVKDLHRYGLYHFACRLWFTLARRMLFGSSGIATSEAGARGTVQRLVMQTALLPDAVISAILGQLNVEVSYSPMNCPLVTGPEEEREFSVLRNHSKVTGICTIVMQARDKKKCSMPEAMMVTVTAINGTHLTISGTLSTTNIIMASWTRAMWQSVVDRAVRMLASGPFGIALLLGKGYCRRKLKLNCDGLLYQMFPFKRYIL
ncbi:hypothetical protein KIN20_027285 [Parelaphostrongylus tenuis]|uniref:Uncharacterized protein n=1 Tax=Parelaphostrongylus tenuis TaxID=148309 RepID=A0AAD5WE01_PARTN|nr:hypothetical protein KIN20_027285 [Parelaphostrongylus tenuis]